MASPSHWLLRFFDFSVTPGKKYKYRVQLVMLDPNQNVGLDQLDSAVISASGKRRRQRNRIYSLNGASPAAR